MRFLGFLLLGPVAGAIARLILPGRQGGGWIATLVLGVIGALLGGWLDDAVLHVDCTGFFSLQSWTIAVAGSLIVMVVRGLVTRSRSAA